jgi:predicted nucleic acid-binding protein
MGLPANDAPILAAATAARVDVLVTGDRTHFGHLFGATVGGVTVLSPGDALAHVLEADSSR